MINLVVKTEEEKQAIDRINELEEITKAMFKEKQIINSPDGFYINNPITEITEIFVRPQSKNIEVRNPKYVDDALKLAEAYVKHLKEDWTWKEDYK